MDLLHATDSTQETLLTQKAPNENEDIDYDWEEIPPEHKMSKYKSSRLGFLLSKTNNRIVERLEDNYGYLVMSVSYDDGSKVTEKNTQSYCKNLYSEPREQTNCGSY
jgi:hypothetical protein